MKKMKKLGLVIATLSLGLLAGCGSQTTTTTTTSTGTTVTTTSISSAIAGVKNFNENGLVFQYPNNFSEVKMGGQTMLIEGTDLNTSKFGILPTVLPLNGATLDSLYSALKSGANSEGTDVKEEQVNIDGKNVKSISYISDDGNGGKNYTKLLLLPNGTDKYSTLGFIIQNKYFNDYQATMDQIIKSVKLK